MTETTMPLIELLRKHDEGDFLRAVSEAVLQLLMEHDVVGLADQLRARWPKLATLMDESEADVLAYMTFPAQHRTKLHSTNPLERLNKEVKRRADVVGIFPNEASITRLIGAILFEQNDEWQTQHRYMQLEAMAQIDAVALDPILKLQPAAA